MNLLDLGLQASQESEHVDFKESLDVNSRGDWCEVIKDIVAMANSGGGVLLIGVNDNGHPSGFDVSQLLDYDLADVTNKLFAYTGKHFSKVEIIKAEKDGQIIAAIVIGPTSIPLVFITVGNYQDRNGKQKSAFVTGMVYFRHGAKSEPCTSDDLQNFLNREIEGIKQSWLSGIRKVVEAPQGSQIIIVRPDSMMTLPIESMQQVRIVDDPNASPHQMLDVNRTHPYRGKDVTNQLNERLKMTVQLNAHDLLSVRRIHKTDEERRFFYQPVHGTPLYSPLFIEWLINKYEEDNTFFSDARAKYHEIMPKITGSRRRHR